MKHLEIPIATLETRLATLRTYADADPQDDRLKTIIAQFEKAINILKKAEER